MPEPTGTPAATPEPIPAAPQSGKPQAPPTPVAATGADPNANAGEGAQVVPGQEVVATVEFEGGQQESLTQDRIKELLGVEQKLAAANQQIGRQSNVIGDYRGDLVGRPINPMAVNGLPNQNPFVATQQVVPPSASVQQTQQPVATTLPPPDPIEITTEDMEDPVLMAKKLNQAMVNYGTAVAGHTQQVNQAYINRSMEEQAQVQRAEISAIDVLSNNTHLKRLDQATARGVFNTAADMATKINQQQGYAVIRTHREAVKLYLDSLGIENGYDAISQEPVGAPAPAPQVVQTSAPPVSAQTPTAGARAVQRMVKSINTTAPVVQPQGSGGGIPPNVMEYLNADKAGKVKIVRALEESGKIGEFQAEIHKYVPQKERPEPSREL